MLVLINPHSHRIRKSRSTLKFLETRLNRLEVDFELSVLSRFEDLFEHAREARDRGFQVVAVGGGDGTLREVATGLVETGLPMGVIPLGISNVFARSLGIPLHLEKALFTLVHGEKIDLDIGVVDNKFFLLMLGAGLDAMAVTGTKQWMKDVMGKGAYLLAGVTGFPAYRSEPIRVYLDESEEALLGYQVVISNVPLYGGKFLMCPDASWDDGLLDVCVFRGAGIFNYSRYVWGVVRGRHLFYPDVLTRKAKRIRLEAEKVPCHIDSDPLGTLPVEVNVRPRALKILVPQG